MRDRMRGSSVSRSTFDVTTDNKADVVAMLKEWTGMAERMTAGQEAVHDGAIGLNPYAPPSA